MRNVLAYLDHIQQHQLLHRDGTEGGVGVGGDCEVWVSHW